MNALSHHKAKFSHIRYCVIFVSLFLPVLTLAQTRGKVEVIKDPLIDTLIARRASLNKITGAVGSSTGGAETANGYRVQIFFGSSRQSAYAAQAKFKEEYPELNTYIVYTEPNFKVRAGDFRSRLEAEKLVKEVTGLFPSLFIIPERINIPKTEPTND